MTVLVRVQSLDALSAHDGATTLCRALAAAGCPVRLEPAVVDASDPSLLAPRGVAVDASVQDGRGELLNPYAPGRLRVARTTLAGPPLPEAVRRLRLVDQVWLACPADRDALAAAGVPADRLAVLPEPVDAAALPPRGGAGRPEGARSTVAAAPVPSQDDALDALLAAWCAAAGPADDVSLALAAAGDDAEVATLVATSRVGESLGRIGADPDAVPDLMLVPVATGDAGLAALLCGSDVLVVAEPWGSGARPLALGMAMGLAVVAPPSAAPGGLLDDATGWPAGDGDPAGLGAALARALSDPAARAGRGAAARGRARAACDPAAAAAAALRRIGAPADPSPASAPSRSGRVGLVIEGGVFRGHSLAGVNRELGRALVRTGGVDLSLVDIEGRAPADAPGLCDEVIAAAAHRMLPGGPDVTVRHSYPPRLHQLGEGRLVAIMPWEFGPAPAAWAQATHGTLDEVWVPSSHTREGYLEAGADPDRVAVVPNGIDPVRFRPGLEPLELGGGAPGFRFLFVGGLIWRKGIDLLLDAYSREFTSRDHVTLVVKDFGSGGPYARQAVEERIARMAGMASAPRVLRFEEIIPEADMPRLYAACDCLVHPYRGEGYGLPVAEAMACGLPVVIPEGGATADFAGPGTAVLVPSREVRFESRDVAGVPTAAPPRLLEVDVAALGAAMRRVAEDPARARETGARAARRMHAAHTWDAAAVVALARLRALTGR